ncbi:hypothetical protein CHARACLAT_026271 [Characodon lateralis]|uniref:Uncharacterized protein n=1 Tax=Characodon lateralis TaxID=208331 RepID=A0ABU7CUT8_9TELE|nr:hypothetical protein [Characodon lateralis]
MVPKLDAMLPKWNNVDYSFQVMGQSLIQAESKINVMFTNDGRIEGPRLESWRYCFDLSRSRKLHGQLLSNPHLCQKMDADRKGKILDTSS